MAIVYDPHTTGACLADMAVHLFSRGGHRKTRDQDREGVAGHAALAVRVLSPRPGPDRRAERGVLARSR